MAMMKDIAESVGCDLSTVSRVLNGRPNRVSEANRNRIREAAERLGYAANRPASALASGKTRMIGVLIPNVFDGVYAEYIERLDLAFSEAGYTLRPFICHNRQEKENAILEALLHREVDAMIAMYYSPDSEAYYQRIRQNRLPLIFRSRDLKAVEGFDTVRLDIDLGYRALTEHLVARGCREIAIVSNSNISFERATGGSFAEVLRSAGLPVSQSSLILCDADSQESAYRAVSARLREDRGAFDGLLVHNINKVFGCCQAIRDAGLRIPEDVKVTTISDLPLCRLTPEPLTVWAQPVPEICAALVEVTLARLRNPDALPLSREFHSTLIARKSTQAVHNGKE